MTDRSPAAAPLMDWSELLFSSSGRAPRLPSVVAAAALLAILALYDALADGLLRQVTGWLVHTLLFFCGACVLSKRFHDRGRSGWWSALVLGAFVMVWPRVENGLDVTAVLILLWASIELALMPGEAGANRYGPNPARRAAV